MNIFRITLEKNEVKIINKQMQDLGTHDVLIARECRKRQEH